ncbi:SIR2-like domain-containing protein [Geodermatophilus dictyosporus]|uniref:SIR2-like domain-containing protein n=1 Tax=Geodermatophilus dictyosporus TaxID=1523247 RepID=A0A1I5JNY1_9ACTN|nr:SIR2 family protein [Geodermatophilus dictyosporus]SFO74512.1 SIR2-like domain-containing protein [Geodermatophilus dictyosporus]
MDVLEEMRATRLAGRLVPFLGAGMSRTVCRDWQGMVQTLQRKSGLPQDLADPFQGRGDDLSLIRKADRALEALRHGRGQSTADSVRDALLEGEPSSAPPQTTALAAADWPLVMTTNYDDLFLAAAHQRALRRRHYKRAGEEDGRSTPYQLAGRSSSDCHRVLSSLSHPSPPILWALQGFVGGQATIGLPVRDGVEKTCLYRDWAWPRLVSGTTSPAVPAELQDQLVVGHADYRRVALRSESFRRAFAEVFRSRSLLFLGSGLGDRYLMDLFGQVIELVGPSPHPHFAIATRGGLQLDLLQRDFGIWVHEISGHQELPATIQAVLGSSAGAPCASLWGVSVRSSSRPETPDRLTITAGPLPRTREPSTCVVVSGGGSEPGYLRTGRRSRQYMADMDLIPESAVDDSKRVSAMFRPARGRRFIWEPREPRDPGRWPLLLVARVRMDPTEVEGWEMRPTVTRAPDEGPAVPASPPAGRSWRDVRLLAPAVHEVLEVAAEAGCQDVLMPPLSAGSLRVNSPSSAVVEMIRAWGSSPSLTIRSLTICVLNREARADLRAGRLVPSRVLPAVRGESPPRSLEYWLEVVERTGRVRRVLRVDDPRLPVREVLREFSLDRPEWRLRVWPAPCLGWEDWDTDVIDGWEWTTGRALSLERFGILLGSTLTVHQLDGKPRRIHHPGR